MTTIDLGQAFDSLKLRVVNRTITKIHPTAVRLSANLNNGVAWVSESDFSSGTLELDVRGKDVYGESFVGVAFHRQDDSTYEVVYLRPFNFRVTDPARHQHAVQYISLPDHDYDRLRADFPEEFENPVDASIEPTGWVRLRVVVEGTRLQVFVGPGNLPALEVRQLGNGHRGQVGLWVGNGSDGDFANLVVTRTN